MHAMRMVEPQSVEDIASSRSFISISFRWAASSFSSSSLRMRITASWPVSTGPEFYVCKWELTGLRELREHTRSLSLRSGSPPRLRLEIYTRRRRRKKKTYYISRSKNKKWKRKNNKKKKYIYIYKNRYLVVCKSAEERTDLEPRISYRYIDYIQQEIANISEDDATPPRSRY